jgi:sugar lactone lactonase YvrE
MPMTPTIRSFLFGMLSICGALLAQLWLINGRVVESTLLYAAAGTLFVWTMRRTGVGWLSPAQDGEPATMARTLVAGNWPQRTIGLLLLLAASLLTFLALRDFHRHAPWTTDAWLLYVGAVAASVGGVTLLSNLRLSPLPETYPDDPAARMQTWLVGVLLLLICINGIYLRVYRFDELPFGVWYDEAENGLQALRLLADPNFRPVYANSTNAPAHYIYLIAAAFAQFGVSVQSIRLVSVIMGIGTILAGYLVGRELFGRVGGLSAAFLFAFSRWDINLSRIGMYNIATPLFALLTAAFLLRGIRRRSLAEFGLAGLCLGLGLSFYSAFQLFAAAMGLFGLLLLGLEPRLLRRYWLGLLLALLVALIVLAPVLQFAYDHPDIYFGRTQQTSLFADKAQAEWLPALAENSWRHLLMFNWQGDPNGRHNLPNAPMLDPVGAALFVLGTLLALWRWREPRWLLLPLWLGTALLGGILSLDFEAPQSLRAVGTLPAAYLLAASVIHLLWLAWSLEGGRYYPAFFAPIAVALLLPIALYDSRVYFTDQAVRFAVWNNFSTPETITARQLRGLDPDTDAYVSALFHGHPTMRFLAPDARPYGRLETDTRFPLPVAADRSLLLMIDVDRQTLYNELRALYPNGVYSEHRPPQGGAVSVYEARLSPEDLASIQGVTGSYFANVSWDGEAVLQQRAATIDADWRSDPPLTPPFSVEWSGVLRVAEDGEYGLALDVAGPAEIYIDERLVTLDGLESLRLAKGNHALRVRVAVAEPSQLGPVRLLWRPPGSALQTIPSWALYSEPVRVRGLLGSYFANSTWDGVPSLTRIDEQLDLYFHVTPLPRPYTVEWTGKIAIPTAGRYTFGIISIDESRLWIDDEEVTASAGANEYREAGIELVAGLHDIRVRFADRTAHTHITLSWQPPWGGQEPVPADVLLPPLGDYHNEELPSIEDLVTDSAVFNGTFVGPFPAESTGVIMAEGLSAPRGIAAANARIYAADTGNGRILILDRRGNVAAILDGQQPEDTALHFVEPVELEVDRDGRLYVLDPLLARLVRIDPTTEMRTVLPIAAAYLDRSRGLFVDSEGHIWIANTPNRRIAAFDAGGLLLHEFLLPEADAQPVDVVVTSDGTRYVTDAGLHRLLRYASNGELTDTRTIPRSNSLDGPHLALRPGGALLVSEPEGGRVIELDPRGGQVDAWQLPGAGMAPAKPVGITVDADGSVWAVDSHLGHVVRQPAPVDEP